jgi:hypothetical protein
MSTGVCGKIYINFQDVRKEVELAFNIEKIANNFKIGTKLGGNISSCIYDKYCNENHRRGLIFELTDSPLDSHAEYLFAPGSYENNEPLPDRMKKVQNLLETLLKLDGVIKISLEMDYLFATGDEDEISIRASDFCEKMIKEYNQNKGFLPVLKLDIVK